MSVSVGTWDQAGILTGYDSKSGKSEIALCLKGSVPQYKARSKKKSPTKVVACDIATVTLSFPVTEAERERERERYQAEGRG